MAGMEHVISVEELLNLLSRKVNVVRKEAGETSWGNDQPIIDACQETESSSAEVQLTERAKQRWERLEKAGDQAGKTGPKIQKVTFLLRDHKNAAKNFEPRVVSIGPIHHDKPKYQKAEEYKLRLANMFIKECAADKEAKILYGEIEKKIKQLREYFDEEVTKAYVDEYLAWMLFVDGCAVLQLIYCAVEDKFEYVKIKNDQAAFWKEDLFLLENQLPYQLLEDLMELSEKKERLQHSIDCFIDMYAATRGMMRERLQNHAHLLDHLRTNLLDNSRPQYKKGGQEGDVVWLSLRNVQELRAAGIKLKPSETSSLTDVTFASERFTGHLCLPQIIVDDSTGPKFLNLIAYEMCPDFDNDFGVTSYICFLDSLINHSDDVKELRKANILHNELGSDIKVAQLFNDIGIDLVPNPKTYADVKWQIQKCYDNNIYYIIFKMKTWIREVVHDHFRSPWAILGLLAASSALFLTAIQTWYTVYSPPGPCDDFCRRRP